MNVNHAVMVSSYLQQLFTSQVPLLDVIIPGATVENVSVHGQRLHAVLMSGIERVAGAEATLSTFCHLIHLENKQYIAHRQQWEYNYSFVCVCVCVCVCASVCLTLIWWSLEPVRTTSCPLPNLSTVRHMTGPKWPVSLPVDTNLKRREGKGD